MFMQRFMQVDDPADGWTSCYRSAIACCWATFVLSGTVVFRRPGRQLGRLSPPSRPIVREGGIPQSRDQALFYTSQDAFRGSNHKSVYRRPHDNVRNAAVVMQLVMQWSCWRSCRR